MTTRENVWALITLERDRQDVKWGAQRNHSCLLWNAILGEEVGEATKEVLDSGRGSIPTMHLRADDAHIPALKSELVQVAAVVVNWLENLP